MPSDDESTHSSYDHPSGRSRIYGAMRWKAENLKLLSPSLPGGK